VAYVLSFQWVKPWESDDKGKIIPDDNKRPTARMLFVVFFGYMIVLATAVVAVSSLLHVQATMSSGLGTNSHENRQLLITVQAPTQLDVAPFETGPVLLPVNVTLGFKGAPVGAFIGGAVFTVERLDAPLSLRLGQASSMGLDALNRRVEVNLTFNPRGGFESKAYDIFYSIQYNVSVPSFGNFTGFLKDSLAVTIEGKGLISGWYLIFIFGGILMSFWWRIANSYLEDTLIDPRREDLRAAYFLLLPIFSSVIALVIFQQFQKPTTTVDVLSSAIVGFVYGFFWESATEKMGRTIKTAM